MRFSSIDDRRDRIPEAHAETFEWIFHDPKQRDKPWANFAKWLGDQDGLYWIGGKAGSGKSTLMRYVFENRQTRVLLQKWSGETEPLLVSYFFWKSGQDDQASQEGLMRSLLYDILRQKPGLIKEVCQDAWQTTLSSKPRVVRLNWWNCQRVKETFDNLSNVDFGKACLFIDGLDECTGDPMDTINILRSIMKKSSNVKVCASSRPEFIFNEEFMDDPKLLVQDLTFEDIKLFVNDKLHKNKKMEALYHKKKIEAPKLVEEIVHAANGVFLWVKLVLKSLLSGLNNRDDIAQLRRRLKAMPSEIEQLYKHMLKNIDPTYAQDALHIFQIMSTAHHTQRRLISIPAMNGVEFPIPELTALELSFALESDHNFAVKHAPNSLNDQDMETRIERVDNQLRVYCSGLLEMSDKHHFRSVTGNILTHSKDPSAKIEYLHRTTKDFLDSTNLLDLMLNTHQGSGFSPSAALVRARLVMYKSLSIPITRDGFEYYGYVTKYDWSIMKSVDATFILAHQAEYETLEPQVELIDELNKTIRRLWYPNHKTQFHWAEYIRFHGHHRPCKWHDDFLAVAVTYGLHRYVSQKLGHGSSILRRKRGRPYLDYALCQTFGNPGIYSPEMVQVLFQHGAEPNTMFNGISPWVNFLQNGLNDPGTAYSIMELLLQRSADPSVVSTKYKDLTREIN